jgi:hypothetical protein
MSTVLAGPPGECCAKGFKHSGEPAGTTVTIADLRTYLSEPRTVQSEGPKKVILFFSDIFGPYFLNNQLLQDYYASQGMHAVRGDLWLSTLHGRQVTTFWASIISSVMLSICTPSRDSNYGTGSINAWSRQKR